MASFITFGMRKTRGLCVSVHECWSVCERREWEEKRLAHRELNSLLLQRTAFRTSPAHTTNHNTSDILLSCVRVTHACIKTILLFQEQKCRALKSPTSVSSGCGLHCSIGAQSKRRLLKSKFHSVQTLLHVAFDTWGKSLIALMLQSVEELEHRLSFNVRSGVQLDPVQISTKVKVH